MEKAPFFPCFNETIISKKSLKNRMSIPNSANMGESGERKKNRSPKRNEIKSDLSVCVPSQRSNQIRHIYVCLSNRNVFASKSAMKAYLQINHRHALSFASNRSKAIHLKRKSNSTKQKQNQLSRQTTESPPLVLFFRSPLQIVNFIFSLHYI